MDWDELVLWPLYYPYNFLISTYDGARFNIHWNFRISYFRPFNNPFWGLSEGCFWLDFVFAVTLKGNVSKTFCSRSTLKDYSVLLFDPVLCTLWAMSWHRLSTCVGGIYGLIKWQELKEVMAGYSNVKEWEVGLALRSCCMRTDAALEARKLEVALWGATLVWPTAPALEHFRLNAFSVEVHPRSEGDLCISFIDSPNISHVLKSTNWEIGEQLSWNH